MSIIIAAIDTSLIAAIDTALTVFLLITTAGACVWLVCVGAVRIAESRALVVTCQVASAVLGLLILWIVIGGGARLFL